MANLAFSLAAGSMSLAITVLAALEGATAPAIVFGVLSVGFAVRAAERHRLRRR